MKTQTCQHVRRHLVLGGVKSGKSRFAEQLASQHTDKVTLIATAQPLDEEMQARIQRHQKDRPASWQTIEAPLYLAQALQEAQDAEVVIIDCLTLWLTNLLMQEDDTLLPQQQEQFVCAVEQFSGVLILVANETNLGIMPMGELSRRFCDEAGVLHQRLAQICEQVDLVVAGLPLNLKSGD